MKGKGFTLIELLAVIIILAIIILIVTPIILNVTNNAKKDAFKSSVYIIIDTAEKSYALSKLNNEEFTDVTYLYTDGIENSIPEGKTLKYTGDKPKNGIITVNNIGKVEVALHNGTWCVTKSYTQAELTIEKKPLEECIPDKTPPIVEIVTNGMNDNPATTIVNVTDEKSDLDIVQYKWDIGTATPTSGWENFNSGDTLTYEIEGTYYLHIKAVDKSGNITNVVSNAFIIPKAIYSQDKGVNVPQLTIGMTPIKWDGNDWINTTVDDDDWYSYTETDKKWANAKTQDGSIWVWLPRYAYQIESNYHMTSAGVVNIKFLRNSTDKASDNSVVDSVPNYSGSSQTNYIKHPAFKFGNTELPGIWVAKFEMSGTITSLDSKPGIASLRSKSISDMFTSSRNMEINNKYGWALSSGLTSDGTFTSDTNNLDTHMIKNIEWGAIAYLSQSKYGKNAKITVNTSSSYYTGGGAGVAYKSNITQSTTGNVYGIYDISGGSYECVMANLDNMPGNSGLTVSSINDKYIDIYTSYSNEKYGDAVYETSSSSSGSNAWHSNQSLIFYSSYPWLVRGGFYNQSNEAGAFSFYYAAGSSYPHNAFRVTLIVGNGL